MFLHLSETGILCGLNVHSSFFFTCAILKVRVGNEDIPFVGPDMMAPLFFGRMPLHKSLPEELCHSIISLVFRWVGGGNTLFLWISFSNILSDCQGNLRTDLLSKLKCYVYHYSSKVAPMALAALCELRIAFY